jgi:hypothetical protein
MSGELMQQVWGCVHGLIRNHGGIVVSEPFLSPMRVECATDSSLPKMLEGMKYTVRNLGSAERLLPTTEHLTLAGGVQKVSFDHVGLGKVQVLEVTVPELRLGQGKPRPVKRKRGG